jgi:membrane protease subunit HflK
VTRDRLYLDAVEEVYASSNKVLIDSDGSGNLLYLPIDKMIEGAAKRQTGQELNVPADASQFSSRDRQQDMENRERRTRQ